MTLIIELHFSNTIVLIVSSCHFYVLVYFFLGKCRIAVCNLSRLTFTILLRIDAGWLRIKNA